MGLTENSEPIHGSTREMPVPPLSVRVLSVQQPWAWLISYGPKSVENRTWRTAYRGPLLIHASLQIDLEAVAALRERGVHLPREYVTGAIVGRARLVDVITSCSSEWFVGPYGLLLADRAGLPVFKCRGKLGLWRPTPEILSFYKGRL